MDQQDTSAPAQPEVADPQAQPSSVNEDALAQQYFKDNAANIQRLTQHTSEAVKSQVRSDNGSWGRSLADAPTGLFQGAANFAQSLSRFSQDVVGGDSSAENLQPIEETRSGLGDFVSGATEFTLGFIPAEAPAGALGEAAGLTGMLLKSATAVSAGAATDFVLDDHGPRLSNAIAKWGVPGLSNAAEALAQKDGESVWDSRFKRAVEGIPVGITSELVLSAIGKMAAGVFKAHAGDTESASKLWTAGQNDLAQKETMVGLWNKVSAVAPNIKREEFEATNYRIWKSHLAVNPNATVDDVFGKLAVQGNDSLDRSGLNQTAETISLPKDDLSVPHENVEGPLNDILQAHADKNRIPLSEGDEIPLASEQQSVDISAKQTVPLEPELAPGTETPQYNLSPRDLVLGLTKRIADDKTLIALHSRASVLTWLEEMTHSFFMDTWHIMPEDMKSALGKSLNFDHTAVDLGRITAESRPVHEELAQQMLRFAMTGNAPSEELKPIFEAYSKSLVASYETFDKPAIASAMNPEIRGVYERLLAGPDAKTALGTTLGREVVQTELKGTVSTSEGASGDVVKVSDLAATQRIPLVPKDVQENITKNLIDSLQQDRLSYASAMENAAGNINLRRIGLGGDYVAAAEQMVNDMIKTTKKFVGESQSNALTSEEADNIASVVGTSPAAFAHIKEVSSDLKDLAIRVTAVRKIAAKSTQDVTDAAKAVIADSSKRPALQEAVRIFAQIEQVRKQASTEAGRLLQSFNIPSTPVAQILNPKEIQQMLDAGLDTVLGKQTIRALAASGDEGVVPQHLSEDGRKVGLGRQQVLGRP